jgi:hypothetical protein
MENQKSIISINLGGISNRIKCLISMERLGEKYSRKVYLYWPLNHTCGAKFSDLFENKVEEIGKEELSKIKRREMWVFEDYSVSKPVKDYPKKYLITGSWRFLLDGKYFTRYPELDRKEGVDLKFSNLPEEIKNEFISRLKKIKPLNNIQKEIDNFSKKHKMSNLIGVHIRRGDFADRNVSPGRVSTDEKFIEKMKEFIKEDNKTKFFLCTDSQEMEEKIEKEFPKRIIKFKKSSFTRTDVRATQEGLIDLYLLSKTKYILGTYRSTFTELAWWLGGCTAKIEMMIDFEKERVYLENVRKEDSKIIPKIKRAILKIMGKKFI